MKKYSEMVKNYYNQLVEKCDLVYNLNGMHKALANMLKVFDEEEVPNRTLEDWLGSFLDDYYGPGGMDYDINEVIKRYI